MPSDHAKPANKRPDRLFLIAAITAGMSILYLAYMSLAMYVANPVVDLRGNIDWGHLNSGLDRIHSFRDTARWWTGTWCGEVPFWRPLTSYVFWGERLLWPREYMLPREVILVALHLWFVALGGLLIWRLTRRKWLVVLSLYLFAGLRIPQCWLFFGIPVAVTETLSDPKNVVELLVGIPMLASLIFLVSGRWVAALAMAALSVCFKETGFMTWPIALLALAWVYREHVLSADRVRYVAAGICRNWLPIAIWLVVLGVLSVIHYAAVGKGYNCGTNGAWHWRALAYFGGPPGASVVTRDYAPSIAAVLLFMSLLLTRGRSLLPRFFAVLGALAVSVIIGSYFRRVPLDIAVTVLLSYSLDLRLVLFCAAWLMVAWEGRHDWQTVTLGLGACFIAAIPTWMAAQALEHARYQATFFMELGVAAVLLRNAVVIRRIYWNLRKRIRSIGA